MKKIIIFLVCTLLLIPLTFTDASDLGSRLKGRILLQVEERGESWYVEPDTKERVFLGRPDDAFRIMRELGLGISEKDFNSFREKAPERLSGKILLRVEANGEAYYVNPVDLKMHFLGRPADAFQVMRNLGLGISNKNLEEIQINKKTIINRENTTINNDTTTETNKKMCNGIYYSNCPENKLFYCPPTGKAVCLNGERATIE